MVKNPMMQSQVSRISW